MTDSIDSIGAAASWLEDGRGVALATVVSTWGSAPCPLGSNLVVRDDGHFLGSVSGGCIEGDVITRATEMLDSAERIGADEDSPGLVLHYDVADQKAWEVNLSCGGRMSVYLESLSLAHVQWLRDVVARRSLVRALNLEGADRIVFRPDGDRSTDSPVGSAAVEAWRAGCSAVKEIEDERWFLHVHLPPVRLVIVGAVHIAQSLCAFAELAGYGVVLIDPRASFASGERFSDVDLRRQWPEDALDALGLDRRCAVVVLTHDPKIDDPALGKALASDSFYVAALGSRKTHSARLERLRALGIGEKDLSRIHGPAGLDIRASTPVEIAVSIMAQMIEELRR